MVSFKIKWKKEKKNNNKWDVYVRRRILTKKILAWLYVLYVLHWTDQKLVGNKSKSFSVIPIALQVWTVIPYLLVFLLFCCCCCSVSHLCLCMRARVCAYVYSFVRKRFNFDDIIHDFIIFLIFFLPSSFVRNHINRNNSITHIQFRFYFHFHFFFVQKNNIMFAKSKSKSYAANEQNKKNKDIMHTHTHNMSNAQRA